jgi:hypothetical protein
MSRRACSTTSVLTTPTPRADSSRSVCWERFAMKVKEAEHRSSGLEGDDRVVVGAIDDRLGGFPAEPGGGVRDRPGRLCHDDEPGGCPGRRVLRGFGGPVTKIVECLFPVRCPRGPVSVCPCDLVLGHPLGVRTGAVQGDAGVLVRVDVGRLNPLERYRPVGHAVDDGRRGCWPWPPRPSRTPQQPADRARPAGTPSSPGHRPQRARHLRIGAPSRTPLGRVAKVSGVFHLG